MKARVIVTTECNRNCDGCCNKNESYSRIEVLESINDLLGYDEIIITGGEPMLIPNEIALLLHDLRHRFIYLGKIYIYTALYNKGLFYEYKDMFNYIDGLHYTLHYEATDREVMDLKLLSEMLPGQSGISFRLAIDSRLYDRYDFSNIDFSAWSVIRKLKWQVHCQLPNDERLFIYSWKESE